MAFHDTGGVMMLFFFFLSFFFSFYLPLLRQRGVTRSEHEKGRTSPAASSSSSPPFIPLPFHLTLPLPLTLSSRMRKRRQFEDVFPFSVSCQLQRFTRADAAKRDTKLGVNNLRGKKNKQKAEGDKEKAEVCEREEGKVGKEQ